MNTIEFSLEDYEMKTLLKTVFHVSSTHTHSKQNKHTIILNIIKEKDRFTLEDKFWQTAHYEMVEYCREHNEKVKQFLMELMDYYNNNDSINSSEYLYCCNITKKYYDMISNMMYYDMISMV